ncbi:MAG: single-stranded DNA-binding protein [Planctomycetota bacterium]
MLNKVHIIGNLGQDPELNETTSGNKVTNLSVATNRVWFNKDKEKQEEVEWHRVTVFGKQAEACKEYLAKGRQVYVEGRIRTRKWEDKEGKERWTTEIIAENVKFLGGKGGGGGGRSDGPPPVDDDDLPF